MQRPKNNIKTVYVLFHKKCLEQVTFWYNARGWRWRRRDCITIWADVKLNKSKLKKIKERDSIMYWNFFSMKMCFKDNKSKGPTNKSRFFWWQKLVFLQTYSIIFMVMFFAKNCFDKLFPIKWWAALNILQQFKIF